jgi:DNA-binding transcriptional LysR family regulator
MDLHALRVVLAVSRTGSMTEAARTLQYSVSSVSYTVRRCEESAGVLIFERTPAGLHLTPRGREFAHLAATILYLMDAFSGRGPGNVPDQRRRVS